MADKVATLKAAVMISDYSLLAEMTSLLQSAGYESLCLGLSELKVIHHNINLIITDYNFSLRYGSELGHVRKPKLALIKNGMLPDKDFVNTGFHGLINCPVTAKDFYYALQSALFSHEREMRILGQIEDLNFKLNCRKFIVMAEVKIIKWLHCEEKTAYSILQRTAMESQLTIEELSIDLLANTEEWCRKIKVTNEGMRHCSI